jgi:hypothetical protein
MLRFVLMEMTPVIKDIKDYLVIGDAEISLGRILVNGTVSEHMRNGFSDISITVNQAARCRGVLSMIVAFVGMPKDHWLMKNYPQLVICTRAAGETEWHEVFGTEVIKRSETGQWAPVSLPCRLICENDYSRQIRLLVRDAEPGQPVQPIGYLDLPVQLLGTARNLHLGLIPSNPLSARAGSILIRAASLTERLTFYGHVQRGLRFSFACSIDFASGNRPASDTKSLHYLLFKHPNAYERIIEAIGGVVEQYSNHRTCYAWGFGARINRQLSQAIPLVNEAGSLKLIGVTQMLGAYAALIEKLQFDGPAEILPSFNQALELVKATTNAKEYLVFLILIHADPADLQAFADAVHANQGEPFSIVIIGVGNNAFPKVLDKFRASKARSLEDELEFDRVTFLKYADFGQENIAQMISTALLTIPDEAIRWLEDQAG